MMLKIRTDVRYRRNGLPDYKQRWGPRTMDVNSFYTHRDRLILDDFGQPTDPRFCSPDIDYGAAPLFGNYVQAYQGAMGYPDPNYTGG